MAFRIRVKTQTQALTVMEKNKAFVKVYINPAVKDVKYGEGCENTCSILNAKTLICIICVTIISETKVGFYLKQSVLFL